MIVLFFVEGPLDLRFFEAFFKKIGFSSNNKLEMIFQNIYHNFNPKKFLERGQICVGIFSIGGKNQFLGIATSLSLTIDTIRKRLDDTGGICSFSTIKVVLIGDKDAKSELQESNDIVVNKKIDDSSFNFSTYALSGDLETLILDIVTLLNSTSQVSPLKIDTFNKLREVLEQSDITDYMGKRVVSLAHSIYGPRCYPHMFETIIGSLTEKEIKSIKEIKDILRISELD